MALSSSIVTDPERLRGFLADDPANAVAALAICAVVVLFVLLQRSHRREVAAYQSVLPLSEHLAEALEGVERMMELQAQIALRSGRRVRASTTRPDGT